MKFQTLVTLVAFGSSALALPSVESRAPRWNDQYIKQPTNFAVNKIRACTYQVTFQRDSYDSRYTLGFSVQHGSASKGISATKGGTLPVSPTAQNIPPWKYDLGTGYDVAVHQFENACSSRNAEPSSFRVHFDLDDNYTYRNDWTSDQIVPSGNFIPAVPQGVTAVKGSDRNITVRWNAVPQAAGYFVIVDGRTYAYELGSDVVSISTLRLDADATSTIVSYRRKAVGVAVSARGKTGSVSDTSVVREIFV